MKKLKFTVLALTLTILTSCGGGVSKQPANAEGFTAMETEIKSKFGNDAYFTDLSITNADPIGNIISVTVTEKPESLKMGQWNHSQNSWTQNSEITLEVSGESKAKDFMFQLNDKINLKTLGELTEKSSTQLKTEKNIEKPKLNMAFINFPDNGDINNAKYVVMLNPENGGTTFTFRYKLNGELEDMDY